MSSLLVTVFAAFRVMPHIPLLLDVVAIWIQTCLVAPCNNILAYCTLKMYIISFAPNESIIRISMTPIRVRLIHFLTVQLI